MRFLIDSSAGQQIADWIRRNGHDVIEIRQLGPDPGDRAILGLSVRDNRILVTIDTDFGELVFSHGLRHAGLVRLPDTPTHLFDVYGNCAPSTGVGNASNNNRKPWRDNPHYATPIKMSHPVAQCGRLTNRRALATTKMARITAVLPCRIRWRLTCVISKVNWY